MTLLQDVDYPNGRFRYDPTGGFIVRLISNGLEIVHMLDLQVSGKSEISSECQYEQWRSTFTIELKTFAARDEKLRRETQYSESPTFTF